MLEWKTKTIVDSSYWYFWLWNDAAVLILWFIHTHTCTDTSQFYTHQ